MAKITLFTTRTCPFCKMQKDYFVSKNIPYDEILVDERPEEIEKMVSISGQMGVPFTVIEKEDGSRMTILGFDRIRLDKELGL